METNDTETDQIVRVIKSLGQSWREKQFGRLETLFVETVVFQDAEGHRIVEGKSDCIQSYRDFMEIAKVLTYEEEEPDLVPLGGFVMANYGWQIDYEMEGASFHDQGRDWLAMEKREGAWLISWRLSLTVGG
jgi:ketosteroid isomerase-like protein